MLLSNQTRTQQRHNNAASAMDDIRNNQFWRRLRQEEQVRNLCERANVREMDLVDSKMRWRLPRVTLTVNVIENEGEMHKFDNI